MRRCRRGGVVAIIIIACAYAIVWFIVGYVAGNW